MSLPHDFTELVDKGSPQLVNLCNVVSIVPRSDGGVDAYTTNGIRLTFRDEDYDTLRNQFLAAKLQALPTRIESVT